MRRYQKVGSGFEYQPAAVARLRATSHVQRLSGSKMAKVELRPLENNNVLVRERVR